MFVYFYTKLLLIVELEKSSYAPSGAENDKQFPVIYIKTFMILITD